jgi:hypothetical protein
MQIKTPVKLTWLAINQNNEAHWDAITQNNGKQVWRIRNFLYSAKHGGTHL